ncbi:MAG TPA: BTAD domain-containing putative transcriptional regulator [Longimicrobiales bacterium]|nr:BTAD domain-containing putative transcriptional regulator [Longimicrobiales bacterium]
MLRLITLGGIELTDAAGRPVESILKRPKRLALLTYLAMVGEGSLRSRDTVLGLFWPEHDQARARQSLNQALYVLRGALGRNVVVSIGNDQIGLASGGLWCDAVALRAAERSGDHRSAQAHYRGEFLPGFFLGDSPDFERWLDTERATLRRLASSSAWKLATEAAAAGDVEVAAESAVRSAELALREEAAVRRAIELLDGLGERARALDLYRELEAELAEDLETTPSPETQRVVAEMRQRQPSEEVARAVAAGRSRGAGEQVAGVKAVGSVASELAGEAAAAEPTRPERRHETAAGRAESEAAGAAGVAGEAGAGGGTTVGRGWWRDALRGRRLGVVFALGATTIAIAIALTYAWARTAEPSGADAVTGAPPRLQVEPFDAYAADDRLTDIAGAITAALAARLAEVGALEVLLVDPGAAPGADSVALAVAGRPNDGRAWFIVRGRVLRDGDRMRAVVSLIDRPTGQVIGSATIERITSDPIAFVDEATHDAARFTRAAVGRELRERAWRASTRDREAWRMLERAEADRREARALFDRGATDAARVVLVEADSLLALTEDRAPEWIAPIVLRAHVARERMWTSLMSPTFGPQAALRFLGEGVAHADRALAIDSTDARARELKGVLLHWSVVLQPMAADSATRIMRLAEAELRAAVAEDPKRAEAWSTLSAMLYHLGRYDEAYYAAQKAYDADAYLDQPQEILVKLFNGAFEAGDDAAARRWCMDLRERFPGNPTGALCALTLLAWGETSDRAGAEAWRIIERAGLPSGHPFMPHLELLVGTVLARAGEADSAEAVLQRVRGGASWNSQLLPLEASLHLALDQPDSAAALLRQYVDERPSTRHGTLASRRFEALRE